MNLYCVSAVIALALFGMGLTAFILGGINLMENRKSKTGRQMFYVCTSVFFWNFGYAWMSLCFEDDFAYVPRAIALLAVTFYMLFTIKYVALVTEYPLKRLYGMLWPTALASLIAWTQIISKDAVTFAVAPWGYWYTSKMTWARIVQFTSVIVAIALYYVVLHYGKKRASGKRDLYVLKQFGWFGIVLFTGYLFDTLIPTVFHTQAIPGSCIGAFISAMILFSTSRSYKTFGVSKTNVSEYVFRDVTMPVIVTDQHHKIVLFNDITNKYLDCDDEDIMNREIKDFFCEQDEIVAVVGSDKVCKLDKTDIDDQFGDLLYSIYFVQDITKEQQTLHYLEESRIVAEEASKAKSNFLANMSHEIRTPMNAIIGMSQIILDEDEVPNKIRSKVSDIQVAGNNLLGIINDILDLTKIETGKYELVPVDYELGSLLNDVSNIINVRVQESNTRYALSIDPTMPFNIYGDEVRVRQVLLNILGNATKFTHKGMITLKASWNHDEKNPELYFDVTDTGIGIKEEDMDKIFGEFNQVDTRKNRNIQGTGLGLAISKHLAELMGGTITVESVYGEGSTFHIIVKQDVKEYKQIGEKLATTLQNHEYTTQVKNKKLEVTPRPDAKVLIVDDTKLNLVVAKGVMKRYQMQIDTATSGMQSIEMVQQKDYDIVFMDHMMPEMDGVDAMKQIRALGGKYENLTIIALSANVISEAKVMFLEEGMQDFLAKPIEAKALDDILNKWLPVS